MGRKIQERAKRFYRTHLEHWKTIGEDFPKWSYSSDAEYSNPRDLLTTFHKNLPGPKVLGAGCGPVGRDLRYLAARGCKPVGIDFVEENIESARNATTEEVEYEVADLTEPLPFRDSTFHGVLSIAVIQYMTRTDLTGMILPSFARVLVAGGVLLLVFKNGKGVQKVADTRLKMTRYFRLYDPKKVVAMCRRHRLFPVHLGTESVDPWVEFEDERGIRHSALLLRKSP